MDERDTADHRPRRPSRWLAFMAAAGLAVGAGGVGGYAVAREVARSGAASTSSVTPCG